MPNYCYNCGSFLKKKKGNCPKCGTPFIQDRKLQIPRRYQAPERGEKHSEAFQDFKTKFEASVVEDTTPSKGTEKFLKLLETTDLLEETFMLLAKKVEYLARKEIELNYGLNRDKQPNFCTNCGYKIDGDWKLCPKCGKKLIYEKLNFEKANEYIQKAMIIDPDNREFKFTLERAQKIIEEQSDKENANYHLGFIREHYLSHLEGISNILTYTPPKN